MCADAQERVSGQGDVTAPGAPIERETRVELATSTLEEWRSDHLSYSRIGTARRQRDSNPCTRLCRPLDSRSPMTPGHCNSGLLPDRRGGACIVPSPGLDPGLSRARTVRDANYPTKDCRASTGPPGWCLSDVPPGPRPMSTRTGARRVAFAPSRGYGLLPFSQLGATRPAMSYLPACECPPCVSHGHTPALTSLGHQGSNLGHRN